MPAQGVIAFPWEQWADALDQLRDADRHGSDEERQAAKRWADLCRQECVDLAVLFVVMSLESTHVQRKLGRVFGSLGVAAFDAARRANARADAAEARLDALERRLRELERRRDTRGAAHEDREGNSRTAG